MQAAYSTHFTPFIYKKMSLTSDCDGVVRCKFWIKFVHVVTTDKQLQSYFIVNKYWEVLFACKVDNAEGILLPERAQGAWT